MQQLLGRLAARVATSVDRPGRRYAAAALIVALAAAVRLLAAGFTDFPPSFPTFYVAVLLVAVIGGLGPGLAAIVLSVGIVWAIWLPDPEAWPLHPRDAVEIAMFVLCGGLIVLLVEAMRLAVREGLAAEQRFRTAQEASLDAFVILEPIRRAGSIVDFRWTYANPAAEALRPAGVSSLIGRRVSEAFPDATGIQMIDRLSQLHEADGADDIEVHRVINGVEHWMRSSGVRLNDGVAVTFRDVTLERRTTTALRSSEEQFRSVANAAPVLIWISDTTGDCVWFNDAWLNFTGREMTQEIGRGWSAGVHPEDFKPQLAAIASVTEDRLPFKASFRLRRADGAWRWITSAGAPRTDAYGHFQGYIGSCVDFTEVVETRQDLEARVQERTAALEASNAQRAKAEAALAQVQRLETVGRLTGGVAHDFNNLLTVIVGGLDMILRRPSDVARVQRMAEAALAAGQRGERLTRQLLAFSRNQELKLETVDLPALITQIEPLIRRAVGEAKTLTVRVDAAAGGADVDPAQFEAALINLVVNAEDATPEGGEIIVEVAAERLAEDDVPDVAPGDYVRVSVADSGHGMSPEVLSRVFEPFFRTKEVGKGTGLGLAQVYGFVRQCGGGVTIDSAERRGTRVTLHMPAASGPATSAEAPGEASASADAARAMEALVDIRILLVEDDPGVRTVAEGLLRDFGCQITVVENAADASALLGHGESFDLLLSDIVMPGGMSGIDLARQAAARAPRLAIVLTTGYAGDRLAVAPSDLPWPVIRKPFRADLLAQVLVDALAARKPARRVRRTKTEPST